MTTEENTESIDMLNTEADLAADFIEELFNIADLDGDIEMGIKNNRAYIHIVSEDKKALTNFTDNDGSGLLALQEITRLAVGEQIGEKPHLLVDVNNWREEKTQKLNKEAEEAFQKIQDGEESVEFESMNSFDRKIIHDKINELGGFSISKGVGKSRHVVVVAENPEEKSATENNE
ncbi:MAG: hypothetical protein LBM13_04100 [Candidatus Ancillula sp.]|jgi:spoIIIJ-associated protein|nr:hypothetical protein [Candidatus Ancillula sp.]